MKKKRFPSNGLPARCSKRTKTWCPTLSCEDEITSGRWRGLAFNTDSTVSLSTDRSQYPVRTPARMFGGYDLSGVSFTNCSRSANGWYVACGDRSSPAESVPV